MKEVEFQNKVLIPLFRNMKYRDVTPFDGMSLERGKDIVMWKAGDLGERINYGVLIKAVKVTGKVSGDKSAMEILNQAKQLLGNAFIDPVTGRKQEIQRCYVVSSQPITKEAMFSIEGELAKDGLNKVLNFIHPETNLFDLIAEHLPEQGVFEKLASVQESLDESMKNTPYRLVANSEGTISILGKHDKAHEEMPFNVTTNFTFDPSTEKGKAAREKLKEHFEKGVPVEIDGEFIESVSFPDFLPSWMKPTATKDSKLLFMSKPPDQMLCWRVERRTPEGNVFSIDRIDLKIVQQGTKEITLSNSQQQVPWKFTFFFDQEENVFRYELICEPNGFNVASHLQALRFRLAMSKEGETSIFDSNLGLKLVDGDEGTLGGDENLQPSIEVLEALVFIQEKTSFPITLPERIPSQEEIDHIFEVEDIIRNGKINAHHPSISTRLPIDNAEKAIDEYKNEVIKRMLVRFPAGTRTNILDTLIDLGPTVATFEVVVTAEDFTKIKENIDKKDETVEFRFTIQTQPFVIDYLQWECDDRHTRILVDESNQST